MHTPGPWKIETLDTPVYGSDGALVATGVGIGTQSEHIVTVTGRSSTRAANAAYLVRCVNSHEALVEALKAARTWMDNRRHIAEYVIELALVHDALALAEGKE